MALWGTEDTLEGKPKIFGRSLLATGITNDPRAKVYATTAGWVYPPVKAGGTPETLVAIRGLSTRTGTATGFAAAGLAAASITSVNWNDTGYDRLLGGTVSVSVNFNETVTVSAGNPTLWLQMLHLQVEILHLVELEKLLLSHGWPTGSSPTIRNLPLLAVATKPRKDT